MMMACSSSTKRTAIFDECGVLLRSVYLSVCLSVML